jgi:DNA repair protein RadC
MDPADAPDPALHRFFEMAGLKFDLPLDSADEKPSAPRETPVEPSPRRSRRKGVPKRVMAVEEGRVPGRAEATAEKAPAIVRYDPRIQDMPSQERPRERLLQHGPEVLNTAELLAILLRAGTEQRSALGLAEHLLSEFDGLRGVARMTVEEMSNVNGIGPAKAAQIKAAIEFGRRLVAASPEERPRITSPRDVYNLIGPSLRDEKREHFVALLLDTKNGVLRHSTISIGDLSSSIVHPREVFSVAVRHSAASLIVAHNHPSGDPTPSPEDAAVTRRLVEAGGIMGIEVLDHIVIGDNRWVSLREKGLM